MAKNDSEFASPDRRDAYIAALKRELAAAEARVKQLESEYETVAESVATEATDAVAAVKAELKRLGVEKLAPAATRAKKA